jgi:hypothetical protein
MAGGWRGGARPIWLLLFTEFLESMLMQKASALGSDEITHRCSLRVML